MRGRVVIDQVAFTEGLGNHVVRGIGGPGFAPVERMVGRVEREGAGVLQADEGDLVDLDLGEVCLRVLDGELHTREGVVERDGRAAEGAVVIDILLVAQLGSAEDDVLLQGRGGGRGIAYRRRAASVVQGRHAVGGHVRRHAVVELDRGALVRPDVLGIAVLVDPPVLVVQRFRRFFQEAVGGVDIDRLDEDAELVLVQITGVLRVDRRSPGLGGIVQVRDRLLQEELEAVELGDGDGLAFADGACGLGSAGGGTLQGEGDLVLPSGRTAVDVFLLLAGSQCDGGDGRKEQ